MPLFFLAISTALAADTPASQPPADTEAKDAAEDTSAGGAGDRPPAPAGVPASTRSLHWSQVTITKRATIRPDDFPKDALRVGDARCVVRLYVDPAGQPYAVTVRGCPEVYQDTAGKVGLRYRFEPWKDETGTAVYIDFDITIAFKADD